MKLDMDLLSIRFFQMRESPPVSTEGVNPYLLEHVVWPCIREEKVCYGDIDYSAFEDDDLQRLSNYCDDLYRAGAKLGQLAAALAKINPEACKRRMFC